MIGGAAAVTASPPLPPAGHPLSPDGGAGHHDGLCLDLGGRVDRVAELVDVLGHHVRGGGRRGGLGGGGGGGPGRGKCAGGTGHDQHQSCGGSEGGSAVHG